MAPHSVRAAGAACVAALAAFLILTLPSPAAAQQGLTTGSISGTIVDQQGQPLDGATVVVENLETGATSQVETDENGRYTVALLRPGRYTVRAEMPPLEAVERGPVQVKIGEERAVSIALQPVEVEEIVAMIDEAVAIDPTQGGVIESVSEEQINELPTAGRDFTDFINLSGLISPQPNITTGGQFSVGGARTSGTNVTIDGADANNAFFGENRGSSRIPFAFSLESIKEFQIVTNGYDVEYGKFSGGLINAVTKGGTNDFDASFFVFARDEDLTARNFDDTEPQSFGSWQFGGTVSGPIIEDKLHYFIAGDFQQRDQPVFTLTPEQSGIPASEIDEFLSIVENVYGISTEMQSGRFEETDDENALFGRLDWTINDRNRTSFRVNYTDFTNKNDRISRSGNEARSMGGTFMDEAFSIVGEWNSILDEESTMFNTLRVHFSDEDRPRPANSRLPSVVVNEDRPNEMEFGGNFFGILHENRLQESKFQVTDNFTWRTGDHTFKLGTDNIFSSTQNDFWLNGNGFFTFSDLDAFREGEPGFFFRLVPAEVGRDFPDPDPEGPVAKFDTAEWSVYAQDKWQATEKLLVTLGLRYDYTEWLTEPDPLPVAGWTEAIGEVAAARNLPGMNVTNNPNDTNNLGPRFSFTYDVEGNERKLVRGGLGVFYARIPTVLHSNVLFSTPTPLLAVICIGAGTPEFDYGQWQDGEGIPTTCAPEFTDPEREFIIDFAPFGIGIRGNPQIALWDEDLDMPRTYKANLGYEQRVGDNLKVGVQGLYSRTYDNFHVQTLNVQGTPRDRFGSGQFVSAEGRPVHIEAEDFDPTDEPNEFDVGITNELSALYRQTDTGKAEIWNLKFDVQGRPVENLRLGANYTWNYAFDNTSFVCCTANAGVFDIPTAGNPNFVGDFGDEDQGAWGPSDFERRHVFVANAVWQAPWDVDVGVIYRAQSGNPFTPFIGGDINADQNDGNDRPYIPNPADPQNVLFGVVDDDTGELLPGSPAEELAQFQAIMADDDNDCLREAIGTIINRNTCNNPWWHSVDVKVSKAFRTFSGQEIELTMDLFNLLDAFSIGAGEFVFKRSGLFRAEEYDPETNRIRYSVDERYGQELPVGFGQLQFQAQLGARYRF
ncbi:MAG: TonB-dependent receptor [Gemmatimonadota bacterium]|nr:TonB-dependent receptor [Gemmatimonadota bacterium]